VLHRRALSHFQFGGDALERRARGVERGKRTIGHCDECAAHDESTSGLTMFGGRLPSRTAMMLSTTILAMASRTSTTALPRCGVITTLVRPASAASTCGSFSNT